MRAYESSMFSDQDAGAASSLAPALLQEDMARMFRLIGVQSVRALVVDLASKAFQAGWSIDDSGSVVESMSERGLDSVFPGATALLGQLTQESDEEVRLQRLSPRRWAFVWRIDAAYGIVAEAHYRDRKDAVSDIDWAAVQLVCNASIRNSLAASAAAAAMQPGGESAAPVMVWPQVERRANRPSARGEWLLAGLGLAAVLLTAWVALVATPGAQHALATQLAGNAELRKTTDATLAQRLSAAMATGDYGEAQHDLSTFQALGYFQRALITNSNGKVVAMAGAANGVRIGATVEPAMAASSRAVDLALGSVNHGQLLIVAAASPAVAVSLRGLQITAFLALLAALSTLAAMVARRLWLRRRPDKR